LQQQNNLTLAYQYTLYTLHLYGTVLQHYFEQKRTLWTLVIYNFRI